MKNSTWLGFAQRLNAIAENGLSFADSGYDKERYHEIKSISLDILAKLYDTSPEVIVQFMPPDHGYQTPKVDIRSVVLNADKQLLMVQEKVDENRWSLPGGWADVGYTPFEVAQKEVFEETGLEVKASRLLAVFDKKMHPHPPQPWYVYKFYILCKLVGGTLTEDTIETGGASWIDQQKLSSMALSTDQITLSQLDSVLTLCDRSDVSPICD